tara:strand:- start:68 stop:556 length:489 start_codon:yes stop_codon:yes gene_type:complete
LEVIEVSILFTQCFSIFPKGLRVMRSLKDLVLSVFLVSNVIAFSGVATPDNVDGQECQPCQVRQMSWASPASVRSFEVTEMQMQTQWQKVQVQVPVVRKFEEITMTREVFDGGLQKLRQRRPRRLRAFNWGCVAQGVAAYISCSTAKRGERVGLLRRIFQRR